jgi:glutaredoxin
MEIIAYTLPGCSHCTNLKELFRRADVDYTEVKVKSDITVDDFQKEYPSIVSFPFVVIDKTPVGGLVETVKLFVSNGLIQSSKKQNGNS